MLLVQMLHMVFGFQDNYLRRNYEQTENGYSFGKMFRTMFRQLKLLNRDYENVQDEWEICQPLIMPPVIVEPVIVPPEIVPPEILEPVMLPLNFAFFASIEPSDSTLKLLLIVTSPSRIILLALIVIFSAL